MRKINTAPYACIHSLRGDRYSPATSVGLQTDRVPQRMQKTDVAARCQRPQVDGRLGSRWWWWLGRCWTSAGLLHRGQSAIPSHGSRGTLLVLACPDWFHYAQLAFAPCRAGAARCAAASRCILSVRQSMHHPLARPLATPAPLSTVSASV